jgi:hypothetical protein
MSFSFNRTQKVLITVFVLISMLATAVYAQQQKPFSVTTITSVPHIMPGDRDIGLEFILQNNENVAIDNIKIYLYLRSPFSASIPPNNKLGELSYPGYLISSGGQGDEYTEYFNIDSQGSHKTFFRLDIDREAAYGLYDLPYTITYGNNKEYSGKITLSINGNTLIEVKNVEMSNGSKVEPGDSFKINVTFENVGDNEIKWLKLSLIPSNKVIIPLSSAAEHIFKNITSLMKAESEFDFSLEKNAPIQNYPIDLILNYMDERGIEYNETKLIGIEAQGRALLDIAKKITDPTRIEENNPFTLTLKIENTGTGDAKGVTASLESSIEGDTIAYLGEIKRDDYSNALFTLNAAGSGKTSGILHLSYEDDFGRHEIKKDLILLINPSERPNLLPVLIMIIAIAAIVFLWIRRRK